MSGRKILIHQLILIILLIISKSAICVTSKHHIYVLHINGINTEYNEAKSNLNELHETAKITSNFITWDLLYNKTHGLLASDLWDTFRQKRQENKNLTIDDYVDVYMKVHHLSYPRGSEQYEALKAHIKDDYVNDLGFVGKNFADIHDQFHEIVGKMAANINKLIGSNAKQTYILFIPHSQGTLYANALVNFEAEGEHLPTENMGVFAIGNPADKVISPLLPAPAYIVSDDATEKYYITADNDFVINSLRTFSLFLPVSNQPQPATTHLNVCHDANLCHSLRDAYLSDEKVALSISKRINLFIYPFYASIWSYLPEDKNNQHIYFIGSNNSEPADLLDPDNQLLCIGNRCNQDKFGSLFFNSDYFPGDSPSLVFSYDNALKPGEYSFINKRNTPLTKGIRMGGWHLTSAYVYNISRSCVDPDHFHDPCKVNKADALIRDNVAFFEDYIPNDPLVCQKFPSTCYNNNRVIGKFTIT